MNIFDTISESINTAWSWVSNLPEIVVLMGMSAGMLFLLAVCLKREGKREDILLEKKEREREKATENKNTKNVFSSSITRAIPVITRSMKKVESSDSGAIQIGADSSTGEKFQYQEKSSPSIMSVVNKKSSFDIQS